MMRLGGASDGGGRRAARGRRDRRGANRRRRGSRLFLALLLGLAVAPADAVAQDQGEGSPPGGEPPQGPLVPEPAPPEGQRVADPTPPAPASPSAPGPTTTILSDEWKRSTWAYVMWSTVARAAPADSSRAVKRLRTFTADDTPELVLALALRRNPDGGEWVKVRLPMRPNNRTGWVRREALGTFRLVTTALRVDRRRLRAKLYRGGRLVWRARIGIGKRRWPTPAGRFYVRERLVPPRKNGIYGVFAFGLSAYSSVLTDWPGGGVIGIHGTNQPGLIPGRVSHGCIRVRNGPISRLRRLMPLGTPVHIR